MIKRAIAREDNCMKKLRAIMKGIEMAIVLLVWIPFCFILFGACFIGMLLYIMKGKLNDRSNNYIDIG